MRMLVRELMCDDGGDRDEEVIASGIGGSGSPCDLFGRDRIAGREGLLDGFVDPLLLMVAQVLARHAVTRRILDGAVKVNPPGGALLVTARWCSAQQSRVAGSAWVLRWLPASGPFGRAGDPTRAAIGRRWPL
jgi:hypothetical protein